MFKSVSEKTSYGLLPSEYNSSTCQHEHLLTWVYICSIYFSVCSCLPDKPALCFHLKFLFIFTNITCRCILQIKLLSWLSLIANRTIISKWFWINAMISLTIMARLDRIVTTEINSLYCWGKCGGWFKSAKHDYNELNILVHCWIPLLERSLSKCNWQSR